jgi:hypothetical protein
MTDGPFAVDVEAALDALDLARGDEYDEIWISDGKWNAHAKRDLPLPTREPEHLEMPSAAAMDDPHVLRRVHTGLKNL